MKFIQTVNNQFFALDLVENFLPNSFKESDGTWCFEIRFFIKERNNSYVAVRYYFDNDGYASIEEFDEENKERIMSNIEKHLKFKEL